MNNYYQYGYNKLGPFLWGYVNWLLDNFVNNQITKVYFLSRDGLIMKRAFELLKNAKGISTYYLEVSRRSLRVPILWKNYSFSNIMSMISPSMLIELTSIFDVVGLDINNYKNLIHRYGFDLQTIFYRDQIFKNEKLLKLYDSLSEDIKSNSIKEYNCLTQYLKQNNIEGKFAIVDIGWSGGMQRFLQTTLYEMGINANVYGYYTGVADYYKRNITDGVNLNLNGYLFDFYHNPSDVDVRSGFVGLYELLFLETQGSVKKYYTANDGNVEVERYDYEYNINGHIAEEVSLIHEVQNGALQYVSDYSGEKYSSSMKESVCSCFLESGNRPTKEAIDLFSKFRFFDEGICSELANPHNFFFYIVHLKQFKIDFLKSRWKTAFLQKIFKLPFSYHKLYNVLKKFGKK